MVNKNEHELRHAQGLIMRGLFAWLGITVFVCGVFGNYWGFGVALMVLALGALMALVVLDVGVSQLNQFVIRPTIATNNRWFVWLLALTVMAFLLLCLTPMGGHQLKETVDSYAAQLEEQKTQEEKERMHNAHTHGRYETNAQLGNENPVAEVRAQVPDDPQRDTWTVRVWCFSILFIFTLFYLFVSRWDELQDAAYATWAKFKEKAEGDITKAVVKSATAAAPTVAAGIATKGGSVVQGIAAEAGRQLTWDIATGFFERIVRNWRRR